MSKQWPEISFSPPFPVLQVASSPEVAQFNILLPCLPEYIYHPQIWAELISNKQQIKPTTIRELLESEDKQWRLIRVKFTDLQPEGEYHLKISHNNTIDSRRFRMLPRKPKPLRFAFSNCLNDETFYIDIQRDIYTQLQKEQPDLLIIGGDLVYIDSRERWYDIPGGPQEKDCLIRYLETWQRLDLYRLFYLIPTLTIWDDHDYGVNDGDRHFPYKETTLQLHQSFFGADDIENVYLNFNQGRVSIFSHQEQTFLLLDNRYFRIHDNLDIYTDLANINELDYSSLHQYFIKQNTPQRYNLFGQAQEEWLLEKIQSHSHQFIWLVGGNQFFGNHHQKESYSRSNPEQFYHFLEKIKACGKPFAILSGDIHVSELSRYYLYGNHITPIYEFGISPMHSTMKINDCQQDCYQKLTNPYRIKDKSIREQNLNLNQEILEKICEYGLASFRYNFGIFNTKLDKNQNQIYLDTRIKIVTDQSNPLFNFAVEIY